MPRALRTIVTCCALLALLCAAMPAPAHGEPGGLSRYIVRLVAAPLPAADVATAHATSHADALEAALAAITTAVGAASAPVFIYRHAISGFALDLTPAQAARIATLPGVVAVQPERFAELLSDTSPNLLGTAQADLSPALFHARLAGGPPGSGGRTVAHYDSAAGQLSLQLFYQGLGAAPTSAELRDPAGARLLDLAPLAVGAPGASGGYIGALDLPAPASAALLAGELELRLVAAGGTLSGALAPSRGEGVLVGVIDSGIDPGSPSFQDPAPDGYSFSNPRGGFLGACNPAGPRYDRSFPCNNKLIGAYTFDATAGASDPQGRPSPHDNHGHGSHTAGIAVGNYVPALTIGLAELGPLAGVAPRANLVVYDVCGVPGNDLSCPQSALLAAIDQAIADGVAVINFSIGAGAGDPWAELEALGMLSALDSGIFVAAAAGNRGPEPDGISAPANAPWVTAVAAGAHARRFVSSLERFNGGDPTLRPDAPLLGAGFAPPLTQAPIRSAAALDNPECAPFGAAQPEQLAGVIIACAPGAVGRREQAANVREAGAAGAVLLNSAADGDLLDQQELYPLPAAQLSYADGQRLSAWLAGCADCRAGLSGTQPRRESAAAAQISVTSSRGPNSRVPGVLKPNLAAPGQAILAPVSDRDPLQPDYFLSSGTSMAAPHIAGLAALLRQIHPGWSPAELSSALMLTAAPMRLDATTPAGPFAQGAGRAQGAAAAFAGFVLPEQPAAFAAADPARSGDPTQLNLAGLTSEHCTRSCSFTRTLRSTLEVPVTYAISLSDSAGFSLASAPADQLTLAPGASATLVITATVTGAATGSYSYGAVSLRANDGLAPPATLPVALKTSGVNLPAQIAIAARERSGSLAIPLRAEAISRLEAQAYGLTPLLSEQHELERGGHFERELSLPANSLLLHVHLDQTSAPAPALAVYADRDRDDLLQADEILCAADAELRCELGAAALAGDLAAARTLRLRVSSGTAGGPGRDSFRLSYGLVRAAPPAAPTLDVSGPVGVAAGEPFTLTLAWQLPEARLGERYLGLLALSDTGDGTAAARDLGTAVITLELVGHQRYLPLVAQ